MLSFYLVNVLPKYNTLASDNYCSEIAVFSLGFLFLSVLGDFNCLVQNDVHELVIPFEDSCDSALSVKT